jgi:dTDP-4-dehydrorhamnose reductase
MNVLVLGKSGMLGSMLYRYLKHRDVEVYGTQRKSDHLPFYLNVEERYLNVDYFKNIPPGIDYVVNCIGVNRFDRDSLGDFRLGFYVNAVLPAYLQEFCDLNSIGVIHMSTDAVFAGDDHPYYEDHPCDGSGDYATSKRLGEIHAPNVLNVRCSIIGHEVNRHRNLLSWFLSQEDGTTIQGYTNHVWNGVTTLQLSEFLYRILTGGVYDEILKTTNVIHFSPNIPLTKFELLGLFKEIYEKNIRIAPSQAKEGVTRILNSRFEHFYLDSDGEKRNIREEVIKMKDFVESSQYGKGGIP